MRLLKFVFILLLSLVLPHGLLAANPLRLESLHCRVYFERNLELAAQTALEAAEDAIADCSDLTASRPLRRMTLSLSSSGSTRSTITSEGRIYISYNGNRSDLSALVYHAAAEAFMNSFFSGDIPAVRTSAQSSLARECARYLAAKSVKYRYPVLPSAIIDVKNNIDAAGLYYIDARFGLEKNRALLHLVKGGSSERSALRRLLQKDLTPLARESAAENSRNGSEHLFRMVSSRITIRSPQGSTEAAVERSAGKIVLSINGVSAMAPDTNEYDLARSLTISDTGELYFARYDSSGCEIRRYSTSGALIAAYSFAFLSVSFPVVRGDTLYFCAGKNNGTDIAAYSLSSSALAYITNTAESEYHLFYDAAGVRLLYSAGEAGGYSLCEFKDGSVRAVAPVVAPGEISINGDTIFVGDKSITESESELPQIPASPVDYREARVFEGSYMPALDAARVKSAAHKSNYSAHIFSQFSIPEILSFSAECGTFLYDHSLSPFLRAQISQQSPSFFFAGISSADVRDPLDERVMVYASSSGKGQSSAFYTGYEWHPLMNDLFSVIPRAQIITVKDAGFSEISSELRYRNMSESPVVNRGISLACTSAYSRGGDQQSTLSFLIDFNSGFPLLPGIFLTGEGGFGKIFGKGGSVDKAGPLYVLPRALFAEYRYGTSCAWGGAHLVHLLGTSLPFGAQAAFRGGISGGSAWNDEIRFSENGHFKDFSSSFSGGTLLLYDPFFLSLDALWPWRYKNAGYPDIYFSVNLEL